MSRRKIQTACWSRCAANPPDVWLAIQRLELTALTVQVNDIEAYGPVGDLDGLLEPLSSQPSWRIAATSHFHVTNSHTALCSF